MKAIFNDTTVDQLTLDVNDRGLQYGDGLFETIKVKNKEIIWLGDHLNRLKRGMQVLQLRVPANFHTDWLADRINTLLEDNQLSSAMVNILVWRKEGGTYMPTGTDIHWLLKCRPVKFTEHIIRKTDFCNSVQNFFQPYSPYKSDTLKYVLAGLEKKQKEADDLLILDHDGNLSETIDKNIFWTSKDVCYTPSLETGCIDGIMRAKLIRFLQKKGVLVSETKAKPGVLDHAETIYACNVSGIYAFETWENRSLKPVDHDLLKEFNSFL